MMANVVLKTIIAEAGGDPSSMAAVAAVIHNRAVAQGKTPEQIVKAHGQFEGYSNPGPASIRAQNDPKVVARASQVWNGIKSGSIADPTNGATMYHADYVTPYWAKSANTNGTVNIGGNIFYKGSGSPQTAAQAIDSMVAPNPQPRPTALAYAPPAVRAISVKPNGQPADLMSGLVAKYPGLNFTMSGNTDKAVTGFDRPPQVPRAASPAPSVPQSLISHPVQTVRIDPMTGNPVGANSPPSLQDAVNAKAARIASGQEKFTAGPSVPRPVNLSSPVTKTTSAQAGNVAMPLGVVPKSVVRDMAAINAMQANVSGSPDVRSSPMPTVPRMGYPSSSQLAAINGVSSAYQQPITHTAISTQDRLGPGPTPLLAFNGDQATGIPAAPGIAAINAATVPYPRPRPMPPLPSMQPQIVPHPLSPFAGAHASLFGTFRPPVVNGTIPGMVLGPMGAPPPGPQPMPGVSFLNAQGVNTANMSAGQVQNALMDAINGKQRGSFGAGNSN